ncbi:MAG: hypothetical protein HFG91_00340 [Acholeplasmatales bacterium]|jgi:hypothetical protein|nr:hypothetical protein [Acholeplasmatales bacterium]MCI9652785.1 hypothetical protein [Acholeplasmatales bacterium]
MKKIHIFLSIILFLLLVSCSKSQVDAEFKYLDENQVEQVYYIKKTEDPEQVRQLVDILKKQKADSNFNGIHLKLKSNLEGQVMVDTPEKRSIDLGYNLNIDAITNFKKYQLDGTIILDGYTNTESPSLTLKTKDQFTGTVLNDDAFLYMTGDLKTGNTQIKVKHKLNIQSFTDQYKAMIISSLDVLKYYKLSEFIPNMNNLVDLYEVTIVDTTKDTFTLRLNISNDLIFPDENITMKLPVEVIISCNSLLPIGINLLLDEFISKALQNEYIDKYLSNKVVVNQAKGSVSIEMNYGYFTIEGLTEKDKQEYKEYK